MRLGFARGLAFVLGREWGVGEEDRQLGASPAKSGGRVRVGWMERVLKREGSWAWYQIIGEKNLNFLLGFEF